MGQIKVMVVDDSAFMRKVISDILQTDPQIEVIYRARNGLEATEKVKQLMPDVITLDVEMPRLNGLETLNWIMEHHPVPVVMLSSLTQRGTEITFKALENGAVDFIGKPSGSISLDIEKVGNELIQKVKTASRVKTRHPTLKPSPMKQINEQSLQKPSVRRPGKVSNLVLVGTSTGGPKALQHFLADIPADINGAFLIVQHMPPGFTKSLARRLDSLHKVKVIEAEDGQEIENGTVYIAPGDYHMEVKRNYQGKLSIHLNQNPPRGGHRPSVNNLFESAIDLTDINKYVVIMTGMGNDGTEGLRKLQGTGVKLAIAEDQSTCVVYGMPRAAIETGYIDHIVNLPEISKFLINHMN